MNLAGDEDEEGAVGMAEDTKSGTIDDTTIVEEVVGQTVEAGDGIEAGVGPRHQEGDVVLLVVKVLLRDGPRLSSGIVNVRNVKLLRTPLLVHLHEGMRAPHLDENLQHMITNRGPITLVCVA